MISLIRSGISIFDERFDEIINRDKLFNEIFSLLFLHCSKNWRSLFHFLISTEQNHRTEYSWRRTLSRFSLFVIWFFVFKVGTPLTLCRHRGLVFYIVFTRFDVTSSLSSLPFTNLSDEYRCLESIFTASKFIRRLVSIERTLLSLSTRLSVIVEGTCITLTILYSLVCPFGINILRQTATPFYFFCLT